MPVSAQQSVKNGASRTPTMSGSWALRRDDHGHLAVLCWRYANFVNDFRLVTCVNMNSNAIAIPWECSYAYPCWPL